MTHQFEYEEKVIIHAISPDNKKAFKIAEEFINKKYVHTSGIMSFFSGGGGGVLYFDAPNKHITAKWIDSQKLEVVHDKDITFAKQEDRFYYCGDDVTVIYKMAPPSPQK